MKMKHVREISKTPAVAEDIPVSIIITFVTQVLTAFAAVLAAKEGITGT